MNKDYEKFLGNFNYILEKAPMTGIKFLYFYAFDVTLQPRIKTTFHRLKYDTNEDEVFILPGVDKTYMYIYDKTALTYMVCDVKPSLKYPNVYNVKIRKRRGDVYLGNHMTICLAKRKNASPLIKTHMTIYDEQTDLSFIRDEICKCNFPLPSYTLGQDFQDFSRTTLCQEKTLHGTYITKDTLHNAYNGDTQRIKILKHIVDVIHDKSNLITLLTGGRYVMFKGRKRKIQKNTSDHQCIKYKGNCINLQQGGAVQYKGITFMTDTFINFIIQYILVPLNKVAPSLQTIQIIFDEFNELGADANEYCVFVYDHGDDKRSYYKIETSLLLKACYADTEISNGNTRSSLTRDEISAHHHIKNIYQTHIPATTT